MNVLDGLMLGQAALVAGVFLAALAFAMAVLVCYHYVSVGAAFVMLAFVFNALTVQTQKVAADLGFVDVHWNDVISLLLISAGVLRLASLGARFWLRRPIMWGLVFGAIMLLAFGRGVRIFGPAAAGVDFRVLWYVFSGTVYFCTVPLNRRVLGRLKSIWVLGGCLLAAIAVGRWALLILGVAESSQWAVLYGIRVLHSQQVLVMTQAFLICAYHYWLSGTRTAQDKWVAIGMLPIILFTQQRTIWVILMVMFVLIYAQERQLRPKLIGTFAVAGLLLAVMLPFTFGGQAFDAIEYNMTRTSTFMWRFRGWLELFQRQYTGPMEVLFGSPFGSGYARSLGFFNRSDVTVTPHNFYVRVALRMGLVGLFLYLGIFFMLWRRLRALRGWRRDAQFAPELLCLLLYTQLLFSLTYGLFFPQAILLGIMLRTVCSTPAERDQLQAVTAPAEDLPEEPRHG